MKFKLGLLIAGTVFVAALLFIFRDTWSANPFENEVAYSNISRVVTDSNGAIYTVTNSKKTLQKVDSSGRLIYSISSSEHEQPNTLQLFNSMAVDGEGNAYALITILDSYGLKVSGEQIIKISPDGSKTSMVYEEEYAFSDNLLRVGNIQSLSAKDGFVYFFRKDAETSSLLRIPSTAAASQQNPEVVKTIEMPANRYLNEFTGSQDNHIFFTTKRGSLYAVTDGDVRQIYPQSSQNQLNFPVGIFTKDHRNIYFIDYHQEAINRVDVRQSGYPIIPVVTMETLKNQYPNIEWSDFTNITVGNGLITVATSDQLVQMNPNGEIIDVLTSFHYSPKIVWMGFGYWLLLGLFGFLLVLDIRHIYVYILGRRVSLLLKQLGVIIPVVLLSMVGLSYSVYSSFSGEMKADTQGQLELLAGNGKYLVDGAQLEGLNSPRDFMSEDYKTIKQRINELFSRSGEDRDGLYSTIYRYMNGNLYIIMDDDDSVTMFQPFPLSEENLLVLQQGKIVSGEWEDASGQWMYALGPLYNPQGEIIGIYETGKDLIGMKQSNLKIMTNVLKIISVIGVILLLVITAMTVYLLSSIRKLRRSVNLIAKGEWDVMVQIHTRDEVEELGERFNMMAKSIRQYIQEVTKLSDSYFRFVPQQFLKVLGKDNVTQINLGEQENRQMTILVCNMRHFTEFSTTLTSEENFRFINSFLKTFGPVIREYGGFTSRYLGAGMLAMFPDDPSAAIKAAVKLRSTLETYNKEREGEPIDIGIAVHYGDVMLGIIGEEQRLEGSVISNHVQLALDLERISEKLGVTVLLTEETLRFVNKGLPRQYRKLGSFQIDGEHRTIELFDLYEGDPEPIRRLKDETKQQFEHAIELFQNGRFYDAREGFVTVVKKNRDDLAAKMYFFACDQYFQEGVTADWNNSLRIS
ncbi:HAMP domain-containing protein [Ammoniphilus resinae]|uniref:Class 3 adenylate cyclase/HAMP domain-containing protein n=1 Tax=Ammoniphilus resinae TaxID=861532 RepID=A0ABS4GPQ8_9BACL|nr:adenylate/guanylate cyclase domain-containing protein [Ammoniphilus resinae]MBP1932255.1 class 3 adenylate cyclase/HAMP domain-containing protein [Ammoniphilus resinae]